MVRIAPVQVRRHLNNGRTHFKCTHQYLEIDFRSVRNRVDSVNETSMLGTDHTCECVYPASAHVVQIPICTAAEEGTKKRNPAEATFSMKCRGKHQVRPPAARSLQKQGDVLWRIAQIRIHGHDKLALSVCEAGAHGGSQPPVAGMVDDLDSTALTSKGFGRCTGTVVASVVDNQDAPIVMFV
jgi:hypothetical protein